MDEVLSVGDAEFQRRCLGRMEELGNTGRTVVFVSHALPAVAQLCDRAIWIDGGQLVGDGQAAEVIANYLHQTHAAGTERVWTAGVRAGQRPREDPRDPGARRTKECRRASSTCAGRSESRSSSTCCARASRSSRRSRCSTRKARSPSTRWTPTSAGFSRRQPGEYVATAWIPGNLLNEGSAIVEAAICSIDFPKLEHHAAVYEAVSFEVLDPGEGDSARGQFSGQWRGVVRPLLDWTCERV